MIKKTIITLTIVLTLSACGNSEPPVKIEAYNKINEIWGIKYVQVKVSAIVDEVIVNDVIVNRGNCKIENKNFITGKAIIPKSLKFGESVSVSFSGPCEASQVEVVTDKGDWTETYQ